ncbi:uncharacterized protein A1O9_07480 [Exophiala aquamarina CBS 119918]|uniref:GRIP domain-containing protein n=1 Tax=Exophiala aquamarina CBS 119918 TaxID=1182545 RepID=A0A072PK63_9EURO|nr:uncharacterized protein A1O9_07480 [Exophiala aquamarina CBS 119918]KEF55900.1 hypothetical protein A1O9_07480 [Exophiala aquamarina CBS 119918]
MSSLPPSEVEAPSTPVETQSANDPEPKFGVESEDASENEETGADPGALSPNNDEDVANGDGPSEKAQNKTPNGLGSNDAAARFDALVKDRDALRLEVTQLRQSIEELQSKHSSEMEAVQAELADTQDAKDTAEEQYQSLLGKVNTIRSQLGERLKADAEELAKSRTHIEELEEQKSDLVEKYTSRSKEVEELSCRNKELEIKAAEQSKELSSLRNRMTLAQQNWTKEKDELIEQEAYLRDEFENAKQAMHDWEILAMEERTLRRDLSDRHTDLEEQVSTLKEAHEKAAAERDAQSNTVDGLQKALQEMQSLRKQELKELVETNQAEQEALRHQVQDLQTKHDTTTAELELLTRDLERVSPFEKEVKEKNLLIGKLRHEAVILNDHLTKAIRFLKRGKPEDNVDRQIVTNHFLHFLALDRSDPKKFQILQLIAALLGWSDEQREQAGLARPGGTMPSNSSGLGSLRLPGSQLVHRTPSTPALHQNHDFFNPPDSATSPGSKESLADLWQNFLEQEAVSAHAAGGAGNATTRTGKNRTDSQGTLGNPPPPPPK